ncbi:hypothetical protein BDZ97DRAFT_1917565 [Flammula alnicola]|nr:hypothetical protein BDZ97DRAFT_1917565 [Flammula alnicola]
MTPPSPSLTPSHGVQLPQEVIDLIIDDIASKKERYILRTCALVSTAFYIRCRTHLFTEIEFIADSSIQRRAGRLCKIFKRNPSLVSELRAFKLVIRGAANQVEGMISEVQESQVGRVILFAILFVLGFDAVKVSLAKTVHFFKLLRTISHAPLRTFSVIGELGHEFDWSLFNEKTEAHLLAIRSNPSLETLELANLSNLPGSVITGTPGPHNLRRLIFRNCTFEDGLRDVRRVRSEFTAWKGAMPSSLNQITTLEMTETSYYNFLTSLQSTFLGATATQPSSLLRFVDLTKLVVGLHRIVNQILSVWNLLTSVAHSLESLELKDSGFSDTHYTNLQPMCISRLVTLRHLKLSTYPACDPLSVRSAKNFLALTANILDTASSATKLESLTINLTLRSKNSIKEPNIFGIDLVAWSAIDDVLNSPNFPELQKVVINLFFKADDEWWVVNSDTDDASAQFFPKISISHWIKPEVKLHLLPAGK